MLDICELTIEMIDPNDCFNNLIFKISFRLLIYSLQTLQKLQNYKKTSFDPKSGTSNILYVYIYFAFKSFFSSSTFNYFFHTFQNSIFNF